ncbi:hypothetical protein JOL62DRAFT_577329 [Phyllosticta paracitricarpa]|uniref:Secreted protein n=1 Tax=Phyllosticta paracitricarpa TaxID=2016321 RepID=A0ABR1N5A1_9PEZI
MKALIFLGWRDSGVAAAPALGATFCPAALSDQKTSFSFRGLVLLGHRCPRLLLGTARNAALLGLWLCVGRLGAWGKRSST